MPRQNNLDTETFTFRTQQQVAYALAQNWSGSLNPEQIRCQIGDHGTAIGWTVNCFVFKANALKNLGPDPLPKSKSPDTWLRSPYIPGVEPLALP